MDVGFLIAALVPVLGAPIGYYIAMQAKAEVVVGHRNILLLAIVCASLLSFLAMSSLIAQPFIAVGTALVVGALLLVFLHAVPHPAAAILIALPVGISLSSSALPAIASFAFVLLLAIGSLCEQKKQLVRTIAYGCTYGVIVAGLFLFS